MVDKWWFVCKPWYKRHDLELNCFHYIWLNSSRIGVQQNIIWLQQMQLNKQSNCNKIDYVLFFTRVQLERKTIHNTHRIRLRLKFNERYVNPLFGIRNVSKYPFIIVSLIWHVIFCISLKDYMVDVSNKHLVPFSARPWQWFLMVIVVVFDVHAVQHFKLWEYHISTY